MTKSIGRRLRDRYLPLLPLFLLLIFSNGIFAQTWNPAIHVTVNDAVGQSQAAPIEGRSMFWDGTNFLYRAYNGTTEVLSYLNTTASRTGNFIIIVDSGGTLQSNGIYLNPHNTYYMFADSTVNGGLKKLNLFGNGIGACSGCLLSANNLSDLASLSTALINLGLNNVNNTSDATKNAATVTITNHTISGVANTLTNIGNASLVNSSIGLTLNNSGTTPQVSTTPAALGTSLVLAIPYANPADSGFLRGTDWIFFHGKLDSVHVSNDSIYNCANGTCTLQSILPGGGAVNSVNGTNASLLFAPSTGNVLGQVNPAYAFNWTGQHTYSSFAPIFSTLTTAGGLFYGNGAGQLLQSGAGTTGQILESSGGTAPTFFTPNAATVNGWLGYTALSNALNSTWLFIGNGSNIATGVALTGDVSTTNTGLWTNTGLKGSAIPSLSAGNLKYNGSNWIFDNTSYQPTITLTTTGTTGPATFISNTLNIPQYAAGTDSGISVSNGILATRTTNNVALQVDSSKYATLYQDGLKQIKPLFLGNLYVKNTWSNLADFTQVGSFTFTNPSNKVSVSGGDQTPSPVVGTNNAAFDKYITISGYGYSMLERFFHLDTVVVNFTPSATTVGVGTGLIGLSSGGGSSAITWFNTSTGTGHGQVALILGVNNTTASISSDSLPLPNNGDTLIIGTHRIGDRIMGTVRNKTQNSQTIYTPFTYDQSLATNILTPNTGQYGIVLFNGSFTVNSIAVRSDEVYGASVIHLGDSKFAGYANGWDTRINAVVNQRIPGSIAMSGEGDRTQDVLNHLPEVIASNPHYVVICAGRNDVFNGVSPSIYQPILDSIGSKLNQAGIPFFTYDAIYETVANQTALIGFIDTALIFNPSGQPSKVIQVYKNTTGAANVASDGVHPNGFGSRIAAETELNQMEITNYGKFLNDKFPIRTTYPSFDSLFVATGGINMNGKTAIGTGPYYPGYARGPQDIVMCAGCGITGAFVLTGYTNRITINNTTSGGMYIDSYINGGLSTPIIQLRTSRGAAGSVTPALSINEGGEILTSTTALGSISNPGDIFIPYQGGLRTAITADGKHEASLVLQDAAGNVAISVYDSITAINFKVSGRTPGTPVTRLSLDSLGNTLVNATADNNTAQLQSISTTQPQFAGHYNSGNFFTLQSGSAGSLALRGPTGFTMPAAMFAVGNTSDSLWGIRTSASGIDTLVKILQPSFSGISTASNGLSASAGNVTLGGTLTGSTTITQANNATTFSGGQLLISGNSNWNPGSAIPGSRISIAAGTVTDNVTAASGTVTNAYLFGIATPTFASSNTGVTITNGYSFYVNSFPAAGTNTTITNAYAFGVGGNSWLQGNVGMGARPVASTVLSLAGATTSYSSLNISSSSATNVTAANSGDLWWNGTNLFFNDGAVNRDLLAGIRNYQHTIFAPSTGGTVALVNKQYNIINPAGALATLTVNLPSSPNNNDVVYIKYTQTVSAVTYGNGTVVAPITAPVAGGLIVLTYDSGTTSWY